MSREMTDSVEEFQWRRAWAIAKKEVAHISRDPFTLALSLILPVVVVTIFGVAIEFNLMRIPTAYLDSDRSQTSRAFVETFGSSDYFRMTPVESPQAGWLAMESESVKAFIVIPPGFERDLQAGRGVDAQVLIDGTDNAAAGSIAGYLTQLQSKTTNRILGIESGKESQTPQNLLRTRFLFNSELNSKWFVVPGLVVVIMSILAVLLTALTVAREWESGSMELLLATPVQPLEIILGKMAPYAVLCMGGVALVYLVARLFFAVPFVGSYLVFLLGCVIALIAYLAQGLLISVVTRKQTLAMQLAMLSGLLPSQLLSGFIFPVESMHPFFRYFTAILPARWFMTIVRASFLQGASFWDLRVPFLALILIASAFIALSVRRFKKDVEP